MLAMYQQQRSHPLEPGVIANADPSGTESHVDGEGCQPSGTDHAAVFNFDPSQQTLQRVEPAMSMPNLGIERERKKRVLSKLNFFAMQEMSATMEPHRLSLLLRVRSPTLLRATKGGKAQLSRLWQKGGPR